MVLLIPKLSLSQQFRISPESHAMQLGASGAQLAGPVEVQPSQKSGAKIRSFPVLKSAVDWVNTQAVYWSWLDQHGMTPPTLRAIWDNGMTQAVAGNHQNHWFTTSATSRTPQGAHSKIQTINEWKIGIPQNNCSTRRPSERGEIAPSSPKLYCSNMVPPSTKSDLFRTNNPRPFKGQSHFDLSPHKIHGLDDSSVLRRCSRQCLMTRR